MGSDRGLYPLRFGEMEKYAVSSGTVRNEGHLFEWLSLGEAEIIRVEQTRSDWLLALLSSGAATSFFIMIGFVALYMEVTSPGFGVPGTVALICFAVVFSLSVMMVNLGSLVLVRQDFVFPEFDWQRELFMTNLLYVSVSLAGAMASHRPVDSPPSPIAPL